MKSVVLITMWMWNALCACCGYVNNERHKLCITLMNHQLIPFQLQASKGCQLLNAKIANHRRRLHFDEPVEERFPLAAFCLVCFPSCCKRSQRVLRRGHWMQRGWRGKCKGASLTGDEGYMKDTYSASLGTGENRWCYDSRASLQRLFSTNVHLGCQLAVTSASACWEGASQWENLGHQ